MPQNQPLGAQQRAVESQAHDLLVLAPPGCGKTEVLAMRADHLLRTGIVRPRRKLLAITFTNRARDNLRNRLTQQLGEGLLRSTVVVVNFHELSARLLEAHHKTIGLTSGFDFPHPAWQRRALAELTANRSAQAAAKNLLAELKRQPLTDDELMQRLAADGNAVALQLEQRRREENRLDYGDLQRLAQLILRNERVASLFQLHFDAVLVDEFQDLSLQQYEIARSICAGFSTYVGDPYQGIFGWAGAQPTEVHADLHSRADETIDLDVSFRSSPAVLNVVNAVSASLGATPLRAADPTGWDQGGHAYAARYPSDTAEATGIVALTEHLATRHPNDTIGVICRAVYRRGELDRAYAGASHPPQFWDIALDTPRVGRLLKLHARGVDASQPFASQVADLRERASQSIKPTEIETLGEVNDACDQLLEHSGEGVTVRTLMSRLRDNQSIAAIGSGVHVLNAHVGKGQQFDWVIVMGLDEGHVPSVYSTTSEAILEEQRILLVMLSRARKGLFLTSTARNTNQYGRTFQNEPSRWWNAMSSACRSMTPEVAAVLRHG